MAEAGGHGFKGITFEKNNGKWKPQLLVHMPGKQKKKCSNGMHVTPRDAAHAYDM